ncbi:MAG: hypothetical protein LBB36_04475 [Fibromonadaceae bacterium]|jgi:hypothetical protein|nr:hypothetical protein [Fibromonadaceae bacterium]
MLGIVAPNRLELGKLLYLILENKIMEKPLNLAEVDALLENGKFVSAKVW